MASATFDALAYFEKLKEAGVPEQQALAQSGIMQQHADRLHREMQSQLDVFQSYIQRQIKGYYEARKGELATREDIALAQTNITTSLRMELDLRGKEIDNKFLALKNDLLKWMFGMLLTQSALLVGAFSFLK